MTWSYGERLYNALPAIMRIRDVEQGEPLRALMSVIESELEILEADTEGLYENWFIETCEEWVVPYIGDLLGVHPLHTVDSSDVYSLRAYVANTLRYRRRKGTAAVLEQLARDVTGWPARAVEFFQVLGTTQHLNHIRLDNHRTPDLRRSNALELLNSPFDTAAHTGEVRRISNQRGKYNIPNIGLFLWRLQNYSVTRGTAFKISGGSFSRFTFSPFGTDQPLFNDPDTETTIEELASERHVPGALRRRALYDDLEAYRGSLIAGEPPETAYFGENPVLAIFDDPLSAAYKPEEILICSLHGWENPSWQPAQSETTILPGGGNFTTKVAVDPELGRLVFLKGYSAPSAVEVNYSYGFSGDVGGGPYDREELVADGLTREPDWIAAVSAAFPADAPASGRFKTLSKAVQAWNAIPAGRVGVIAVLDSRTYPESLTGTQKIEIPPESLLMIVAGDWPSIDVPVLPAPLDEAETRLVCPHLKGNVNIRGTAGPGETPGELIFNGFWIEGDVRVLNGDLGGLTLAHCTIVPGTGEVLVGASKPDPESRNQNLCLTLNHSISGPVTGSEYLEELVVRDSSLDADGGEAVTAIGAFAEFERTTVLGRTVVQELQASECLFSQTVLVARRQRGCTRFCYVPPRSRTPRRYRCQPDLALLERARELGLDSADKLPTSIKQRILSHLKPSFTSARYDHPGYAQLSRTCAEAIRTGGADGAEMGVFNFLKQPQREANLRAALDEYLRFGLEAGIFFET